MSAPLCAVPIKGTHIRIVKVDECGNPVTGTGSLIVVTKGFSQVQSEPQYEDGEEFVEKNADGDLCVNDKDGPILKRYQLTVDLCEVDPTAMAFVLDGRLLQEAVTITGTGFAIREGKPTTRFSLETWQRVAGPGACDESGVQRYIYNAWPNVGNAQMGPYTVENAKSTFQFIGETKAAGPGWESGPVPPTTWLPTGEIVDTDEHYAWNITTTDLPTEQCGPIPWPS